MGSMHTFLVDDLYCTGSFLDSVGPLIDAIDLQGCMIRMGLGVGMKKKSILYIL